MPTLNEAVEVSRAAVVATPTNHANRGGRLNIFGLALRLLYERTREIAVLNEAVSVLREAVATTPTGPMPLS